MKYLKKNDVLITIIILLLDALLLYLFFANIYASSSYSKTERLGSLIFKKRTATRKHIDSFAWNMLKNEESVYELDAIRTASNSEASIVFDDGSSIDLLENTLIKLKQKNAQELGDFVHGSLVFSSTNSKRSVSVGGRTLTMNNNSEIVIHKRGDGESEIEVTRGTVEVEDEGGEILVVEDAKRIVINENDSSKTIIEDVACSLLYPKENEKLLAIDDSFNITFSWKFASRENANRKTSKLKIFSDKDCQNLIGEVLGSPSQSNSSICSAIHPINSGVVYWQVEYEGGLSSVRRLSLEKARNVEQMRPIEGNVYYYYEDFPSINFSWMSSSFASSSILEISKFEDFSTIELKMQVFSSSIELANLLEGKYYWRVYPNTNKNILGGMPSPTVRSFSIVKRDILTDVKLKFPIDGYLCNVNSFASKGLFFNWEAKKEAVEYELLLYNDREGGAPIERFSSSLPFVKLEKGGTKTFDEVGDVYFSVRYKTLKGQYSDAKERWRIQKVNYDVNLTSIYPPDNYTISESLIMNQRFSWKHTLPLKTFFVVARDKEFKEIVVEQENSLFFTTGINLKPDNYYWQVRVYNIDKSLFAQTETRAFSVVNPLDAPPLLFPHDKDLVPVAEDKVLELRWQEVRGADYYDVYVYKEGSKKPLLHDTVVRSTRLNLPVNSYGEGTYNIELQAFRLDSEFSTKNVGYKSYSSFRCRTMSYVKLSYPLPGQKIDGMNSYTNGIQFSYNSREKYDRLSLILKKEGKLFPSQFKHIEDRKVLDVSYLPSGEYEWSVVAFIEDYDLSSKEKRRFTVLPIPPLPAPKLLYKKMVETIDIEYLRHNRSLHFEWQPVEDASYYVVQLQNENTGEIVRTVSNLKDTSFDFSELEKLDIGKFTFKVRAASILERGRGVRSGYEASYPFEIALPLLEDINVDDEEYYGY